MSDTSPPPDGEDRDYYRVLSDVMTDRKEREERAQSAVRRASRGNSSAPGIVAMVCGVLSVYFWTSPPDFLRPDPFPEVTVEQLEAGVRVSLYLQAQRVNRYVEENGQLPTSLEQTGPLIEDDIFYSRNPNGSYELSRSYGDGLRLTYTSDQDLTEFRGNALDVVNGRVTP